MASMTLGKPMSADELHKSIENDKIKENFKDIDWLNERIFDVNKVWEGIARTKKDKIIGFLN